MSLFSQISETWQSLVELIIRPPRHEYDVQKDLGDTRVMVGGKFVVREDFELINSRGYVLKCSHFQPAEPSDDDIGNLQKLRPQTAAFPCVIYCHGNAGSRVDAMPLLSSLLPHGISVCSFDFSGAGQSDGQFLSLGYFEREDLRTVVDFLRSSQRVSRIGLWGHSMGASTCLLYAGDRPDDGICAMVLDSPFTSLEAVIGETAASGKQRLSESGVAPGMRLMPDMLIPVAVAAIRRSILSQAGFDIRQVAPLARCGAMVIPAVFGHGEDDEMVAPYHSQRLHDAYAGNSTLMRFAGCHNSPRGDLFLASVSAFLLALLRPTNQAHPAEGLLYAQPATLRGLMGRPAASDTSRVTAGRAFQSAGVDADGDRCSHRGRTAGNLAQLVKLCCLCNPAIRPPPRPVARRYRIFNQDPAVRAPSLPTDAARAAPPAAASDAAGVAAQRARDEDGLLREEAVGEGGGESADVGVGIDSEGLEAKLVRAEAVEQAFAFSGS